jgi:hypothetical protein
MIKGKTIFRAMRIRGPCSKGIGRVAGGRHNSN